MSRTQTKQSTNWNALNKMLKERGVTLISSGIDESPFGYKDIDSVMDAQKALVEIVAKFEPKLVKMAPDGERAED
jgi:tRNA-splicing ligase RtcB